MLQNILYFGSLKSITWNFTEAGHGKGPKDGIGGVLKCRAGEAVGYGIDIACAANFIETLRRRTKINMIEIHNESVEKVKKKTKIPPIHNITLSR